MRVTSLIGLLGLIGSASAHVRRCDPTACGEYNIDLCKKDDSDECIDPVAILKGTRIPNPLCGNCAWKTCLPEHERCADGYIGPPELPTTSTTYACGQKDYSDKGVTVSFEPCPTNATAKCLIITQFGTDLGTQLKAGASFSLIEDFQPGQQNLFQNGFCDYPNKCIVPIEWVQKHGQGKQGPVVDDICGKTLSLAVHGDLLLGKGDTCWASGDRFNDDGKGNWAMRYSLTFTCPEYEKTCCCCPPPPPTTTTPSPTDTPTSPPTDLPPRWCNGETAYAYDGKESNTIASSNCKKNAPWGWYQQVPAEDVNKATIGDKVWEGRLLAGKTKDRGYVAIIKTGDTTFSVSFETGETHGVGLAHLDASCKNPKDNLGKFCRSPGKYEFNSGCISTGSYNSPSINTDVVCSDYYYFLIHTETYDVVKSGTPGYDTCKAYGCGTTEDYSS